MAMREVLYRGKRTDNGEWVEGFYHCVTDNYTPKNRNYITTFNELDNGETILTGQFEVILETRGEFTGLTDEDGEPIYTGDVAELFGMRGKVTMECGAYGIGFQKNIDWDLLESKIKEITGCNNSPAFCYNDNFISLWEIMWNYNQEESDCYVVKILGNVHDNPELL